MLEGKGSHGREVRVLGVVVVAELPIGVAQEDLGGVGAVDGGSVGGVEAAREREQTLEEDWVDGDDAVHLAVAHLRPVVARELAHADEVGRAVDLGRIGVHVRTDGVALLLGDLDLEALLVQDRPELAHGYDAVVNGDGSPGARKAARGAKLGVVLCEHEVGAGAVAAEHLRNELEHGLRSGQ